MERAEIKNLIPHREPMMLVDQAEMVDGFCVSCYTIPENAFFIQGHFPGNPIVPGVILCEIMAQGSALLVQEDLRTQFALFAGMDHVRFKHQVRPGDTVVTRSRIVNRHGSLVAVEATATVNNQICCKGELSLMLTPLS